MVVQPCFGAWIGWSLWPSLCFWVGSLCNHNIWQGTTDVIEGWRRWNKSNSSFQCFYHGIPALEEQPVMRIHHIGQTKQVMIKLFIVKRMAEERMEAAQAHKQRTIAGALTDQEVRTAGIEELKMLFT